MKSLLGGLTRNVKNSTPVSFASRTLNLPLLAGASVESQLRAMGSVGTLFAIVNRTSNATAQVGWKLWKKAKSGLDEDRTEVTSHLALDIWNKPNKFMTRQEFIESFQQHLDLTGEAWWVVGRNPALRSIPLELWPIRPDKMTPKPHPTEFIERYEYLGPSGERVPLELDEVVFLRMPNPLDPYRGMGPVQSILTDLDSTRYSAEWNRNFFINSAEPGGIIEVEQQLSDDQFNEMRDRWGEQHRGVSNAHRVAILENGAKWVTRAFSQRDMQFVELRNVSREVIREAFGFPKPLLGAVDDVNRANAEAGEVVFARWLIVPRLERIKQALNNDFLPLFKGASVGLEFDYDNPVPDDREADNAELTAKSNALKVFVELGATWESASEALGLPKMDYEKPPPPPPPTFGPPAKDPAPSNRHDRGPWAKNNSDADDVDLTKVQAAWEKALEALLTEWGGVMSAQIQELADQIADAVNDGDLARLAAMTVSTHAGAQLLTAAMIAMGDTAAGHVVGEAKVQGVEVQPATPSVIDLAGDALAVSALLGAVLAVAAGVEALRVANASSDGQGVAQSVKAYLEALPDAEPRRALGHALTGAQNQARFATFLAAPVAALYASEQMDKNTCGPCREIHGKWLGNTDGVNLDFLNKTYPSGGYIGCLGRSRCRGTIVGIWRSQQTGDGQ